MAFKLIAITPELTLPDEAWRITHLLDAGFDAVHLRKPHCGEEEMRGYVDTLPAGIAEVAEGAGRMEGRREPLLPLAGGGG